MKSRLWYTQLDPLSAVRRFSQILLSWEARTLSVERLFIVDFFVASPALLDRVNMPSDYRKKFGALQIDKPSKSFVKFPASSLLFHSMQSVQNQAFSSMAAKGLLELEQFEVGRAVLTASGRKFAASLANYSENSDEIKALAFTCDIFGSKEFDAKFELRSRTGLRRYD